MSLRAARGTTRDGRTVLTRQPAPRSSTHGPAALERATRHGAAPGVRAVLHTRSRRPDDGGGTLLHPAEGRVHAARFRTRCTQVGRGRRRTPALLRGVHRANGGLVAALTRAAVRAPGRSGHGAEGRRPLLRVGRGGQRDRLGHRARVEPPARAATDLAGGRPVAVGAGRRAGQRDRGRLHTGRPGRTRVELAHVRLDKHGPDAERIFQALDGPSPGETLQRFSEVV